MNSAAFEADFAASPLVMQRLNHYAELLMEWQGKLNLVGPNTIPHLWQRHFADSAQLIPLVPPGQSWIDIGTGAGFPGMVIAAMDAGAVVLVESIQKKIRFLEAVRDSLGLQHNVTIICGRAEDVPVMPSAVATARAVAPLTRLIPWATRHLRRGGVMLFPKGRNWAAEVAEARKSFALDLRAIPSKTDPEARILQIQMREGH